MKALPVLFCCLTLVGSTSASFRPFKLPYSSLLEGSVNTQASDDVIQALQQVGMVAITDVPELQQLKAAALSWNLHACSAASSSARANLYPDGTLRRTLATHRPPSHEGEGEGDDIHPWRLESVGDKGPCQDFIDASASFRQAVDKVTRAFAACVSPLLVQRQYDSRPLLVSATNNERFSTFADIVHHGEHLEHFHSYQRNVNGPQAVVANTTTIADVDTIPMHTDQGLFLVFSPGRIVHQDGAEATAPTLSSDFFIELSDGSRVNVDFDAADDLVVLLGDGVHQYVNPSLERDQFLRAVPHALKLPERNEGEARVWYGRMVLPPSAAIHSRAGVTFGQVREAQIATAQNPNFLAFGCSKEDLVARQLEVESCESDTLYCWHKCMPLADYNVSEAICHQQGEEVFCVDSNGHLWDGSHGDFFPGCATNGTEFGGGTIMYMFGECLFRSIIFFRELICSYCRPSRWDFFALPNQTGFRFFLDGQRPFLNFYFVGWTLSDTAKYVGAMIAVFFLGVLVESIVKLRQSVTVRARTNRWNERSVRGTSTVLHAAQELFGYLLMLATMTFSLEFLLMAATGLAVGHALFSKINDGTNSKLDEGIDSESNSSVRAGADDPA